MNNNAYILDFFEEYCISHILKVSNFFFVTLLNFCINLLLNEKNDINKDKKEFIDDRKK